MRAARVIMLIAALLIAASLQSSPLANSNWQAKTSSRDLTTAGGLGASCRYYFECQPAFYCLIKKCVPRSRVGGRCTKNFQCTNNVCFNGKCINPMGFGSKCYDALHCKTLKCKKQRCVYAEPWFEKEDITSLKPEEGDA